MDRVEILHKALDIAEYRALVALEDEDHKAHAHWASAYHWLAEAILDRTGLDPRPTV